MMIPAVSPPEGPETSRGDHPPLNREGHLPMVRFLPRWNGCLAVLGLLASTATANDFLHNRKVLVESYRAVEPASRPNYVKVLVSRKPTLAPEVIRTLGAVFPKDAKTIAEASLQAAPGQRKNIQLAMADLTGRNGRAVKFINIVKDAEAEGTDGQVAGEMAADAVGLTMDDMARLIELAPDGAAMRPDDFLRLNVGKEAPPLMDMTVEEVQRWLGR